jgi:UDP-N-acetyl-D-glucosamine dehydrogenase
VSAEGHEPSGRSVQLEALVAEDRRVAIIGLGYVGLPLAIAFSEAGLSVEGIDAAGRRVRELNEGRSPIEDISDDRLAAALAAGLRVVSVAEAHIAEADAIVVCVPTPISSTKDPDLAPVLAAGATVRASLRPGQLVILQSTTFPGTTAGPFREAIEGGGLKAGVDFDLAYAPERVNPGDPTSSGRAVPRLVGGSTPAATARAAALLRHINDTVVELSSPDAAELAKLLENVFRNVNIALVNNLALLCERMGLDVWEVIDAAATKPFGFMRFTPGPGVGGHCIPVDPYYLSWRAREFDFIDRFIELAGDINIGMPHHVVELTIDALNDRGRSLNGARVGVIGVAFKPNVGDARNSPAAEVIAGLTARGGVVAFHDPHVQSFRDAAGVTRQGQSLDELLDRSDAIIVLVGHHAIDWDRVYERADLIIDTVNSSAGRPTKDHQVRRLGAGWSAGVRAGAPVEVVPAEPHRAEPAPEPAEPARA